MSRAVACCLLALLVAGCRFLAGDTQSTLEPTASAAALSTPDVSGSLEPSPSDQVTLEPVLPTATPDDTAPPTDTPSATPTGTPGELRLESLTWRTVAEPFAGTSNDDFRGLFVNADSELVAWGSYQRGSEYTLENGAAFWSTSDGITWRVSRLGAPGEWLRVADVAQSDNGFVAVAEEGVRPGGWWSEDGLTWIRAPITPDAPFAGSDYLLAVAAGTEGYLAVGATGGDDNTRFAGWFSPTGRDWTSLALDLGAGWFKDVVAAPDGGFVAIGTTYSGGGAEEAIWRISSDGQSWRPAKSLDQTAGAGEDDLSSLVTYAGGYVAFGMYAKPGDDISCKACAYDSDRWRVYTSRDGIAWDRNRVVGTGEATPALPWYDAVESWHDGLIAVGSDSANNYRVWTSDDGIGWESVGGPVGTPRDRTYFTLLVADDRVVLGGSGAEGGIVSIGTSP